MQSCKTGRTIAKVAEFYKKNYFLMYNLADLRFVSLVFLTIFNSFEEFHRFSGQKGLIFFEQ